jgi:hypothetical protein
MKLIPQSLLREPIPEISDSFSEREVDVRDHLGEGIYILGNGDIGFALAIEGIYDEPLSEKQLLDKLEFFQKALRNIAVGVPSERNLGNTVIQCIFKSRQINSPPPKKIEGGIYHFPPTLTGDFLAAEEEYLFENLVFISRRIFLCVRMTPNPDDRSTWQKAVDFIRKRKFSRKAMSLESSMETVVAAIDSAVKQLKSEAERVETILGILGTTRRVLSDELTREIQNTLCSGAETTVYHSEHGIHQAINCPGVERTETGIRTEFGRTDAYSVNQLMSEYPPGMFRHFIDAIPHPDHDLVWTISQGSSVPKNEIKAKEAYFGDKTAPHLQEIGQSFTQFRLQISTFNPYVTMSLKLLVHNAPEGFDSRLQNAVNDYLFSHVIKEDQLPIHVVATSLPLNCTGLANSLKARSNKRTLEKALLFLPIYDGPSSGQGIMWLPSRVGTPVRYNLFSGTGPRHVVIIGNTRSGKGVWMNYHALQFLTFHPKWIVRGTDFRTSYGKLCDMVGGRVVRYSEEILRKSPSSPFAFDIWTKEDLEFVRFLILAVIAAKNSDAVLTATHTNILKQAIDRAYNSQKEQMDRKASGKIKSEIAPHVIWKDIVAQLPKAREAFESDGSGSLATVVEDIQRWTLSLTEAGEYGFIFSAHQSTVEGASVQDERVIIYDLDGIPDPVLRVIAAMIANGKILRDISRYPLEYCKLIIIDELGQQTGNAKDKGGQVNDKAKAIIADMVDNIARTAAKMNAMVYGLSNMIGDFTDENPAGKTLFDLSPTKVILPLGDAVVTAKIKWAEFFSAAEWEIIESLKPEHSLHRSMFYLRSRRDAEPIQCSCFLPLSPYMDALATSSGPQMSLYNRLRGDGIGVLDSIKHMAEQHPYGVGLVKMDLVASSEAKETTK